MTKQKFCKITLLLMVTLLGIWCFFNVKALLQDYQEFEKKENEDEDALDDDYFEDEDDI